MPEVFQDLFTVHAIFTLIMLLFLQAVLGFDNLLYVAIESKRVAPEDQSKVRRWGILLAIVFRVVMLGVILAALKYLNQPMISIPLKGYIEGEFDLHSIVVLAGGIFIMYTAIKEIYHMISLEESQAHDSKKPRRSRGAAIFWIVVMNLVFSFDSILSAIALTNNWIVMAVAIVVGGLAMLFLADGVSDFLKKNRMYEVLGLFVLLLVGIKLISEGGHLSHLKLWDHAVDPMPNSTFYFVLGIMVVVDLAQSRYQKKLMNQKQASA